MAQPEAFLDEVVARLEVLVSRPPFRFKNSTRARAQTYLARLRAVEGFSLLQVQQAEKRAAGRFPGMYRAFLLRMGKRPGQLFRGSDLLNLARPEATAEVVQEILRSYPPQPAFALPPNAHVLLTHQGYMLQYTLVNGELDAPVWWFSEGNEQAALSAPSFEALVDDELVLMERLWQRQHEAGGYYLTLTSNGLMQEHPALAMGERPLDTPEVFIGEDADG